MQPLFGERVVLDGVVQPGRRDLLLVAATRAYAFGDGPEVLGVRPPRLVGLPFVGGTGGGLDFGQGHRRTGGSGHSSSVSLRRAARAGTVAAVTPRTTIAPANEPYTSGGMYGP